MLKKYFTNTNLILFFAVLTVGILLRVYRINSNYYFSGELGKELLYIRQYVVSQSIPLVGMATSHSWLYYGPIYYWFMIPIFIVFNGNPFILFWTALVVSVFGLIMNYLVFKKISDEKIALFSTMIQALSPLLIWQTRLSKLHVFFWVLMPIFTLLLYLIWNGKKKWLIPAGLVFGIMFSFHFSQIPIVGVVVFLFWIKKNIYRFSDWVKFGLGVLIPNLTLVWQDRNLALWLPYRVVNFADKNPGGTFGSLNEYFGKTLFWNQNLWWVGLMIFVVFFGHYVYINRKNITQQFLPFYLTSTVTLMLFANILHGSPPIHYFLPIFTFVPIVLAIYLSKFKFWPIVILSMFLVNLISFFGDPLFYKNYRNNIPGTDIVSYPTQINAVSFILADAKGRKFSLKRIGPFDYFPEQYSQNYKYLSMWKGGKLVDGDPNSYTIVENRDGVNVQK